MDKEAGSRRSWAALGLMALLAAAQPLACADKGVVDSASDTLLALLAAVGPEVVLPALDAFLLEAGAMVAATEAWEANPEDTPTREEAQAAWLGAMGAWQRLEVMQVGPAGSSLTALGGLDLRDEVYSWPTVNPCRVDQETVEAAWGEAGFYSDNLVNSYGLDALERSLWGGVDNDCPSQVDINADGSWAALGDEGVIARRAAFSAALSAGVEAQAEALREAWDPDGGDFSGALPSAGDGAPYPSAQVALNAIFDAMFYLDTQTKDAKLAVPMGLSGCDAEACPEDVELLASEASLLAIAENLRGFRALFTGGEGVGYDDLLAELGHGDLSDEILGRADAAIALAEGIADPLHLAVQQRGAEVQALYDELKALTDLLKGDLATVLSLQIPAEAAGDAD